MLAILPNRIDTTAKFKTYAPASYPQHTVFRSFYGSLFFNKSFSVSDLAEAAAAESESMSLDVLSLAKPVISHSNSAIA